jgi:hypothetical protein
MKKAILYSAMALATLSFSSCGDDFLVIDPAGAVSEGTLSTDRGVDFLLTGAYSTLNGLAGSAWDNPGRSLANPIFGDMLGGDVNEGTQAGDQPDWAQLEVYSISAANPYIGNKWGAVYEAIKRCNNVISLVLRKGDAIANSDVIIAQAEFIKALWTFEGIKMFGAAIPYVSVEDYDANVDPQVSNVDESGNYVYIWDKVEADLKDAINKLPATWDDGNYGRATSWMAKALLGKVYLYWSSPYTGQNGTNEGKLAEAKTLLEDVVNNGVDAKGNKYKLVDDYETLFMANHDWDGEGVVDIQMTLDGTSTFTNSIYGAYYTGFSNTYTTGIPSGWGFYQPTYDYVNSMITDAKGLPAADFESRDVLTKFAEWTEIDPETGKEVTKKSLSTDLKVTVDPRLDISMGRAGVQFLDWGIDPQPSWIRQFTNAGVYVAKKHHTRVSEFGSNSLTNYPMTNTKNFHVIRLADIKLMLAEIAIRQKDLSTAQSLINEVRKRAANSYIPENKETIIVDKKPYVVTKGDYTFDDQVNGKTITKTAGNYCLGLYPAFASEAEAWTALKRERRAELGFEGHRFFDLARWGDVGETLGKFVAFERQYLAKYTNNPGNFSTMPIPFSEIQTAEGRFVQNADWK